MIKASLLGSSSALGLNWIYDKDLLIEYSKDNEVLFTPIDHDLYKKAKNGFDVYPNSVVGDLDFMGEILYLLHMHLEYSKDISLPSWRNTVFNYIGPSGTYDGYIEQYGKELVQQMITETAKNVKGTLYTNHIDKQLIGPALLLAIFDKDNIKIKHNNIDNTNTLLDCGCGNGKNMIYAQSLGYHCVGFDISNNLLDICKNKGLNVYYQDVLNLKNNNKYNKIISIAVLHHLQTLEEQIAAIKNLCDCLDNNGKLLVSFWSKEKTFDDIKEHEGCIITGESIGVTVNNIKSKSDCRDFISGPNYVNWKLDRENIIQRFYYIHDYKSIQELAKNESLRKRDTDEYAKMLESYNIEQAK